jgi:hypothetical protein
VGLLGSYRVQDALAEELRVEMLGGRESGVRGHTKSGLTTPFIEGLISLDAIAKTELTQILLKNKG